MTDTPPPSTSPTPDPNAIRMGMIVQQHNQSMEIGAAAASMSNRPGIQTTEFWVTFIVTLGGSLQAMFATAQWAQVAGIVAAALAAAAYGVSRAQIKAAP